MISSNRDGSPHDIPEEEEGEQGNDDMVENDNGTDPQMPGGNQNKNNPLAKLGQQLGSLLGNGNFKGPLGGLLGAILRGNNTPGGKIDNE